MLCQFCILMVHIPNINISITIVRHIIWRYCSLVSGAALVFVDLVQ